MSGLIHIYCGDGKGKTTAAIGLITRHVGAGGKAVLVQFLKDGTSSECRALAKLESVTMLAANPAGKFSFQMDEEEKAQTAAAIARTFEAATGFAAREGATLLALDEVCAVLSCGFLAEKAVLDWLDSKPAALEVVLTGRDPSQALLDRADYVTEMVKRRHPYDKGIAARKGIEL